jgi:hypothetical protein
MDDDLLDVQPGCDIEIDLQRWTQVTVVINGRTCDVYMDGKLARSCVLPHLLQGGSYRSLSEVNGNQQYRLRNGYVSQVKKSFNYALTPNVDLSVVYGWTIPARTLMLGFILRSSSCLPVKDQQYELYFQRKLLSFLKNNTYRQAYCAGPIKYSITSR